MAGKKRRKSTGSTGKASAKRKSVTSAASEAPIHICSTILTHALEIASSKIRAGDVLQSFYDGKCWLDTKKLPANAIFTLTSSPVASSSPTATASKSKATGNTKNQMRANVDCYWILLAINTMNRLLVLQHQDTNIEIAAVKYLSALSDALATILLSDKPKLEKCFHHSSSRSILCRAILTTTRAAMYGIQNYSPEEDELGKHDTFIAAISTLDRLVHLKPTCENYGNGNSNKQSANDSANRLSTVGNWAKPALGPECSLLEEFFEPAFQNSGNDCVKILLETTNAAPSAQPTPMDEKDGEVAGRRSTRARAAGKTTKSAATKRKAPIKKTPEQNDLSEGDSSSQGVDLVPIVSAFEKLVTNGDFSARVDSKIAVKRWASIAVVWSQRGDGQNTLLKTIHELCTSTEYDNHFTTFQKSRLMTGLISIINETGAQCGVRPPTGSIEQYLVKITSSVGTTTSKASAKSRSKRSKKSINKESSSPISTSTAKKNKSIRRADIRDWTTVAIYDCLQNHKKALLEQADSTEENKSENENKSTDDALESSPSAPKLSDLITSLCRIASSSVQNASYTQQGIWKKTLLSISAAFCFQVSADPLVPLDSKLLGFALSQFVETMRMMPNSSLGITSSSRIDVANAPSTVSENQIQEYETKHLLHEKLPAPIAPTKASASSDLDFVPAQSCKFAGLVSGDGSFTDEHAIALAIRAVQVSAQREDSSPATGKLLAFFIWVVERAYDTAIPKTSDCLQREENNNATVASGKRKSASTKGGSSNRRGGRRRKLESGESQQVNDQDDLVWNRISSEKASVAMTALHAIRMWLMNSNRLNSFEIRRILRNTVTTDHLLGIVSLGDTLDKIIIKSRCMKSSIGNSSSLEFSSCEDFTSSEILLWNAHMSTCEVFGRGLPRHDARNSDIDRIIWSSKKRMAVYEAIAARIDSTTSRENYNVSLPAAHHAVLAANMSCTVVQPNREPEKLLVSSYITSITRLFRNLELLVPKNWGNNGRIMDGNIPLSYNDARTLMLAIQELSFEEKCRYFDVLVAAALNCLKSLVKNKSKRESLLHKSEVSGFIARVLVFCYSLVHRIHYGEELDQIFIGNMGCAEMKMPSFVTRGDWYRQESTFMGLFDTWESPSLPENVIAKNPSQTLPEKSLNDFRSLLQISFSMGFDAAPHDQCHLLFTAWNGLDQVPENDEFQSSRYKFPSLTTSMDDYPGKILQLREDIFSIYKSNNDGTPIDLKQMISNASEITDLVLKNHVPEDEKIRQEISLPVMVLLAALPTYIAAGISGHTKPGNDYFSTTMSKPSTNNGKRRRGYSSGSDPPPSDCESDEDADDYENEARLDAISRLRECCDAFGAAPIHPDWLDVSCSFRDGIHPSDAIETATKAIKTLSRLITIAFTQFKKHQSWAIQTLLRDQDDLEQSADTCSTLIGWSRHVIGPSQYPNDREWLDDVTALTKIPSEVIEYMLDEVPARDLVQTKACWCPFAGQKIRGLLQEENGLIGGWETTNAELRAGREWELLLAEALCVSCLKTNQNDGGHQKIVLDDDPFIGPDSSSEMAKAQLWRSILMSATSHLVPSAALLRLALGRVGRKPHPFAFHENNQDPYDSAPLHFSESLNLVEAHASPSLRNTVHETLSILARLCIEAEDSLSTTCYAIASHLVVDTSTFSDLEAMSSMKSAFMGLKLIRKIAESSPKKDVKAAIPFVVERLVSLIEHCGRGGFGLSKSITSTRPMTYERLHHFFKEPASCLIDTIASKSPIDLFKILGSSRIKEVCEDRVESYRWSDCSSKEDAVNELVSILCEDSLRANGRTRSHLALMLSRVGIIECESIMDSATMKNSLTIRALIQSFNKVEKKRLKSVILKDLCGVRASKIQSEAFRKDIASILCLVLFSQSSLKFDKAKFVHDTLMTTFTSWEKISRSNRELTLKVLLIYGALFNSIFEIGSHIVDVTGTVESRGGPDGEAEILSVYFASLRNLQKVLSRKHKFDFKFKPTKKNLKSRSSSTVTGGKTLPSEFPKSCSFIQKSGFHGQHWYHCHTCGLVADKGCCTLCALVCHRGHDVTYSRHSSFFCDCAAEDGSSADQNRVSCKCLSSLSGTELGSLHANERLWTKGSVEVSNEGREVEDVGLTHEKLISFEIAKHCFPETASKAFEKFLLDLKSSGWLDCLFKVLDTEFTHWKTRYGDSIRFLLQKCSEVRLDATPIIRTTHDSHRRILRERRSKILNLERMDENGFVSVRITTGFKAKLPSDSSAHDEWALARLSRSAISRSILAFDSRGRMIIAEPCSLVFCSPMASVNARKVKKPGEESFTRQQMCILGTAPLSFNVIGLRLCAENERHILVWGTSEVCVLVLKKDYSGIEDTISLTFDTDDQDRDGDILVNCEWLPGSQTHVAVGVSKCVRLFDVCRFETSGKTKRAHPVIGYNLGFEASLRDLSIVPQKHDDSRKDDAEQGLKTYQSEHTSKMFLLLENGRLHSLDIKISNGKIESPYELHFEPSECVSISTEGIRPRSGSSIGLPGASTRTLGEGSKLVYLKQSRCLLYKCKSAAVVALMLGTDGNITGTFELLQHSMSSDFFGVEDEDVYSISGPYTLWTELGMVYRKGETFFRVACVGRSNRNNQPKLLCVEFNEKMTKISEIKCSSGIGLTNGSFEGVGAFTSPIIYEEKSSQNQQMTGERTFLCALSSGGNLHIFGEDTIDMVPTGADSNGNAVTSNPVDLVSMTKIISTPTKKFPLTIFEQLTNVSEHEKLSFSVQDLGMDSKELKKKLSRDTSSSFTSPQHDGCGMTISLSHDELDSHRKSKADSSSLVISAIRVLVGSSPNNMPSKICVQGRSIDITPKLKRWYNVPFTKEEIARGIRTGLVSLWIGPSFDSSNAPIIDSVEVFASERKWIEMSMPRTYFPTLSIPRKDSATIEDGISTFASRNSEGVLDGLLLGVRATTNLCDLIGPSVCLSGTAKRLLSELIQVTTVHPDKNLGNSLQMLADCLDSDKRARWSFQDENMLVGCSRCLDECNALLDSSSTKVSDEIKPTADLKWKAIRMVLKDCLRISTLIARERPNNYLQSMGNMQENNLKSGSIAIEAAKLILKGLQNSTGFEELIGGSRGIVTLSLTEMAIVVYMDDSTSTKDFMQISQIREFLDVANASTCESISTFFQDDESEHNEIPDLFMQMEAARRVAYQCDSCGICPMKKVRYTILEDDYEMDLCKKCYEVGKTFASNPLCGSSTEVVINDKRMGENLTCAHMKKMVPVSLEKIEMDVEGLEVSGNEMNQKDVKMTGENLNDSNQQDLSGDHRGYDYFLGELYSFVMKQLECAFKKEKSNSYTESLVTLLLDLIKHSKRRSLRRERAVSLVKKISKGISFILDSFSRQPKLSHLKMATVVTCLRGLASLTATDSKPSSSRRSQSISKKSKKLNFICDVHGIPAAKRKCELPGPDKGRRFYVCGKEKGQRCSYMKWADEGQNKIELKTSNSEFHRIVQAAMLDRPSSSIKSIYDRLCILLEGELFGEEGGAYEVSILASNTKEKKSEDSLLESFYSVQDMKNDFIDGLFCSKEKLLDIVPGDALPKTESLGSGDLSIPTGAVRDRGTLLLEASLDLLVLIADHNSNGISRWFSILCEIAMATNKHSSLRSLATKVLKDLCDGDDKKYHYVRDHFTFCFQLQRLYYYSNDILESALIVKEKARQCGVDWKKSATRWSVLGASDLLGTQDLISEDIITELNLKGCGKVLDDMWAIIEKRGESWRQFCGSQSLPLSHRQCSNTKLNKKQQITEKELSEVPPIKVLFWIASSLTGIHQVKVLKMIDFALIEWNGLNLGANKNDERGGQKNISKDGVITGIGSNNSKPEELLLRSENREMAVDDIALFCLHLIHSGKTSELRKVAYQIASKISQVISSEERIHLFKNLIPSIANIGIMGKSGVEFLTLLQWLSQFLKPTETVGGLADFVVDCFSQQLDATKYDRSNCEWIILESNIGNSVTKKKFDLSGCHYCIKPQHYTESKISNSKPPERHRQSSSSRGAGRSTNVPREKLRYEQVSSYSRCRLDGLKETRVSNEFNHFYKLKHRIAISDINLVVSDPRGRYVKTVSVFFTTRPLADSLKSDHYASKWQKIATLNMARGGSRASVSLPQPILAANIRMEFTDFYERPGEKGKGASESMVLHCPRCTRPVTNAHGVCVACGEVAFQCRKCRHINYDRLDAFLCVECGYTSCGSFSLELNAAVVTNAIAITNDNDFEKSNEMYDAASSIQEDLKQELSEKLRYLNKKNAKNPEQDIFDDLGIERSFLGLPPIAKNAARKGSQDSRLLLRFDKPGSVVKQVAHPDRNSGGNGTPDSAPDRSDRTRSLLRLARQIRSESSSSSDRRRSTDVIIRHLGRVSVQDLEDETELLEMLESANGGTSEEQNNSKDSEDKSPEEKEKRQKKAVDDCRKLFFLLREAWRETYELGRRIDAWNNLNSGALVTSTPLDRITDSSFQFTPSHCSACGGSIALNLLLLWLKLFLVAPAHVRVSEEFFAILFQGDAHQSHSKGLQDIKSQAIVAIAINSRHGAEMVLRELEKRLRASRDMYCAGILGKIMEIEGFVMINEYAKLAMDILSSQAHI